MASVWRRWNRELFADLSGLLLGGPAVVDSLMDVVGRSATATLNYSLRGPHPTPYLRTLLSVELLRRMGFPHEAEQYCRTWTRLYPNPRAGSIPQPLLDSFERAKALVVDTVCYQPYETLGNKSLSQVIPFATKEQQIIEEAAGRLAAERPRRRSRTLPHRRRPPGDGTSASPSRNHHRKLLPRARKEMNDGCRGFAKYPAR